MSAKLLNIYRKTSRSLNPLRFSAPVSHTYNPLEYADAPFKAYLKKYGTGPREIVMMGMNPGPWGMAQTGVPFGEITAVRDWLGIAEKVKRPTCEHPKKPVLGFDCTRSEVSGARLWGWAQDTFKTPQRFFKRFFVANYCPIMFLEESGKNLTPDRLRAAEKRAVLEICDNTLRETVAHLKPRLVIGIGKFAEKRAREVLADLDVAVGGILHPSPASPIANRGWAKQANQQLADLGVTIP